jgi:hypothetical protein
MALLGLTAEGLGPFERLDLDFSDGHGEPHLGPHILAGVNGSGKSTVLRAIAWAMDWGHKGFHYDEWQHLLEGYPVSRAALALKHPSGEPYLCDCEWGALPAELSEWRSRASTLGIVSPVIGATYVSGAGSGGRPNTFWQRVDGKGLEYGLPKDREGGVMNVAGYSPTKKLGHLATPNLTATMIMAGHTIGLQSTHPSVRVF